jgi:hypothetical protein
MLTTDELVEKIVTQMDPDDIINLLQITSEELMDHFTYKIDDLELFDTLNEEIGS